MECDLLQKSVFELYNHNDKLIWDYEILKEHKSTKIENIISSHKEKIDNISKNVWNYNKKLINDFELLHIPDRNFDNMGIADYNPISRAFFKMWEIITDFNLLDIDGDIVYGALCEGPGGFIEAFNLYRKDKNFRDTIVAMTLRNDNDECVPSWKKSNNVLKQCNHIYITYGEDNTGNLYNVKNIEHYSRMFNEYKADIVTSDGGFDFSEDYNNQESTIVRLLWSEVVTGLMILKKGGNMVIKIFDIFRDITLDIVYILCYYFDRIYITKPFTSRPLNSEKYIVCNKFKDNVSSDDIINMKKIIENMGNMEYNRVLKNIIPLDFKKCINSINTALCFRQVRYMNKVFNIINKRVMYKEIAILQKERIIYSIMWCKKYNFRIRNESNLINSMRIN
jgi:23S rRNA U2552 (ribose-2'-O)-methylase RlmE/FtsJ